MRVLVFGNGKVGSVLSRLLASEKSVEMVLCCTRKTDAKEHNKNGRKYLLKKLDISNKNDLVKIIRRYRPLVAVNAALPKFNADIMESCLSAGTNYLDMASYWDFDKSTRAKSLYKVEQLDYDAKFRKRGLVGLINAGVSPGLTNLAAGVLADKFDYVKAIKIRLIEDFKDQDQFFAWSKEWLIDEINWKPLVYRNGRFMLAENFSEEESFTYAEPFGKKPAVLMAQEEVGTLPLFIKTKSVDVKGYDSHGEIIQFIYRLGMASERRIKINNGYVSPAEFL